MWEYTKTTITDHDRRGSDMDVLAKYGAEGWELVTILSNNVAYFKREIVSGDRSLKKAPARVRHAQVPTSKK